MRWVFFLLIFGNLFLLGIFWQQQTSAVNRSEAPIEVPAESKRLLLVTEINEPLKTRVVSSLSEPTNQRTNLCYAIGPYQDDFNASHVLARATALGLTGKLQSVTAEDQEPSQYWVHVPPRASRQEAMKTLRELQGRKVDSYIITQGELAEGISLGLFRNRESAEQILNQVKSFDIPVAIRTVSETNQELWVEIEESSQLTEGMRQRIQAEDSTARWEMISCS